MVRFLVSEFSPLVEHEDALDFAAGDEEELFVLVRGQQAEALVQKQRTDRIAARSATLLRS
jgi:hypothetical protein